MSKVLIVSNIHYLDVFYKKFKDPTFESEVVTHFELFENINSLNEFEVVVLQVKYPLFPEFFDDLIIFRKKYLGKIILLDLYFVFKHKMFAEVNKFDIYFDLSNGFDDLIVKTRFLVANSKLIEKNILEYKGIQLDLVKRKCFRNGIEIFLKNKEFELLKFFLENKCMVLTVTQILEGVWDMNALLNTNTVQSHICQLRKKIDIGFDEKRLHTVNCVGYKLE